MKYSQLSPALRIALTYALFGGIWIIVSDNGPGIPSEYLSHLFDRFYQADKARTQNAEDESSGSGLGLAIVQSIAQIHGGEVRVQSAPGEGTVFEARFKLGN